jgi:ArsR family transcriptional regulator
MDDVRLALIGKALAHPVRVQILRQFECRTPQMVHAIVEGGTLAQSTVSEHLRILREAGLLFARKDGPRTWYCMRRSVLDRYMEALEALNEADTRELV